MEVPALAFDSSGRHMILCLEKVVTEGSFRHVREGMTIMSLVVVVLGSGYHVVVPSDDSGWYLWVEVLHGCMMEVTVLVEVVVVVFMVGILIVVIDNGAVLVKTVVGIWW